jgi:hypothetical protein
MEHEAVAFNFAIGVTLVWVLARPGRARSQLPVLLSFVAVLVLLSVVDIPQARVGWYRLASHVPLLSEWCARCCLGARRAPAPAGQPDAHATGAARRRRWLPPRRTQAARPFQQRRPPAARRHVA